MYYLMIVVFVIGYALIALEHSIRIDKAASALLTGVIVWSLFVFGAEDILHINYEWTLNKLMNSTDVVFAQFMEYVQLNQSEIVKGNETVDEIANHFVVHELRHHIIEIAEILFFLLGAMTIVELIDAHDGFSVVTDRIKTNNKVKLLCILSILTFFFSAALDNLTTSIVMSALLKKLIGDKNDLWTFAGIIIIAANAGGAWSPIGDVTTIMLWIGGNITAGNIVVSIFIPSVLAMIIPLIIMSFRLKGNVTRPEGILADEERSTTEGERKLVFALGVSSLLFVPIFKTVTHMPPFMGIMFGLGFMWLLTELLHRKKSPKAKSKLSVGRVLAKIDMPSVLFFLGILLAVAALSSAGHLNELAKYLEVKMGNIYAINVIIGMLSAIVDNVPLVAGAMGMYEIGPEVAGVSYPVDHEFWEFLAYCAGTGGSALIIGSAAGVAVMGILKIDFMWYLKRISLLALAGYFAGAAFYIFEKTML
ncbi:MAG TPA: sodium:proton antiporter [Flavobacteriales bacterium]|jgi:Na+/H+ antiporter NhaD/arsenite permease-like protein|nr:sodium:proton antiporter [Flavobacteriales bacterium]